MNVMNFLPRAAPNIVLRRLAITDLPVFQAYRSDPELGRYQGWLPMSDDEAAIFLQKMGETALFRPGEWAQIGISEPGSSALIGDIGIFVSEDSSHAEIGITLSQRSQGRGLATTALRTAIDLIFDATAVHRIMGIADARNTKSIRLLERVDMSRQEERTVVFRGEKCVELVYALQRKS